MSHAVGIIGTNVVIDCGSHEEAVAYADRLARLIREVVEVAEYGMGRDGCPFCAAISEHNDGCIAAAFGARGYQPEPTP